MCLCAYDDTTTEFSLLWLSYVKAGVYKVCGDLSVKRWEHECFQRINQSEINKRLLTHLLEGKRPSKYYTHKHAFKSHRKSGLESPQSLRFIRYLFSCQLLSLKMPFKRCLSLSPQ